MLLQGNWVNYVIAPVPLKSHWSLRVNISYEYGSTTNLWYTQDKTQQSYQQSECNKDIFYNCYYITAHVLLTNGHFSILGKYGQYRYYSSPISIWQIRSYTDWLWRYHGYYSRWTVIRPLLIHVLTRIHAFDTHIYVYILYQYLTM